MTNKANLVAEARQTKPICSARGRRHGGGEDAAMDVSAIGKKS